jgi:hypothetical protein
MSLLAQRTERGADRRRLVVGRNEHRDGAGRSARGGWRLAGRLVDERGSQVDKCLQRHVLRLGRRFRVGDDAWQVRDSYLCRDRISWPERTTDLHA